MTKGRLYGYPFYFITLQKGSISMHSLRFHLCLMRFAEVDQVQSNFIDVATLKKCKNINGRFNETTEKSR